MRELPTLRVGPGTGLAAAAGTAVAIGLATLVRPDAYPYALAAQASLLLAVLALADPFAGLVGALVYAVIANFLKRLAFALPGTGVEASLAALLPIDAYLAAAAAALLFRPSLWRPLVESRWLLGAWAGLTVVGLVATLGNDAVPVRARIYAVESCILPGLFFPIAATSVAWARRSGRAPAPRLLALIAWLGAAAAAYGIVQTATGLLPFERAWAGEASGWSRMVYDMRYHGRTIGKIRHFSLLSDHQSFGLLEAAALASLAAYGWKAGRRRWWLAAPLMAIGLFLSLTRATWAVAAVALAALAHRLTSRRGAGSAPAWTWTCVLVLSVPLTYLAIRAVAAPRPQLGGHGIGHRIADTGSLEARLRGWDRIGRHGLLGAGYADSPFFASKFGFRATTSGAHNIVVDLDEKAGLVGQSAFVATALLGLVAGWRRKEGEDGKGVALRAVGTALFFALLIGGNFYGAPHLNGSFVGMLFWTGLGLAI